MNRYAHLHRRLATGRRGAALLELAFTLGILLVITFGTIEFGQYFYIKNQVQGAARDGARAAIISGNVNSDVTSAVAQVMNAAGLGSSGYTVSTSPTLSSSTPSGTAVTVTVTVNWSAIPNAYKNPFGVAGGGIGANKQIKGIAVMRRE